MSEVVRENRLTFLINIEMKLELKMIEKMKKLCLDFENEYRKIENDRIFINFDDFACRTVALIDELSIRGIDRLNNPCYTGFCYSDGSERPTLVDRNNFNDGAHPIFINVFSDDSERVISVNARRFERIGKKDDVILMEINIGWFDRQRKDGNQDVELKKYILDACVDIIRSYNDVDGGAEFDSYEQYKLMCSDFLKNEIELSDNHKMLIFNIFYYLCSYKYNANISLLNFEFFKMNEFDENCSLLDDIRSEFDDIQKVIYILKETDRKHRLNDVRKYYNLLYLMDDYNKMICLLIIGRYLKRLGKISVNKDVVSVENILSLIKAKSIDEYYNEFGQESYKNMLEFVNEVGKVLTDEYNSFTRELVESVVCYLINNDKLDCGLKKSDFDDFTNMNKRVEHIAQNVYEPFFR